MVSPGRAHDGWIVQELQKFAARRNGQHRRRLLRVSTSYPCYPGTTLQKREKIHPSTLYAKGFPDMASLIELSVETRPMTIIPSRNCRAEPKDKVDTGLSV